MSSPCDFYNCLSTCSNFPSCIAFPPPPPSPPFTPNPLHEPNNIYNRDNQHTEILVASFSLTVLLFVILAIVRCDHDSGPHHNEPFPPTPAPNTTTIQTTNSNNNDDDDDDDDDVTHHVWLIKTVGLDEHMIKSIAASVYNGSSTGSTEYCSVCLGEFSDGEEIKLLQNCCHVFHVLCIDTWLKSHVNCPLCRKAVMDGSEGIRIVNSEPDQEELVIRIDSVSEFGSSSRSMEIEDDMMPIRRSCSFDGLFSLELCDFSTKFSPCKAAIGKEIHTDLNGLVQSPTSLTPVVQIIFSTLKS